MTKYRTGDHNVANVIDADEYWYDPRHLPVITASDPEWRWIFDMAHWYTNHDDYFTPARRA